jgi:hypothetical protein
MPTPDCKRFLSMRPVQALVAKIRWPAADRYSGRPEYLRRDRPTDWALKRAPGAADYSGQTRMTKKEILTPEQGRSRCPGALGGKLPSTIDRGPLMG